MKDYRFNKEKYLLRFTSPRFTSPVQFSPVQSCPVHRIQYAVPRDWGNWFVISRVHYIGVLFHTFTFVYLPVDMVDLYYAHHSGDTQCSARVLHYRALRTNTPIISSSPGGNICFFVPKKIRETWSESSLWHGDSLTKVCKKFCAFVVGLRTKLVNM